ncbi:hypothetical protein LTR15_009293 [Elasticomyces elasticus]|nr:hypothetical protein LTR15_009293 [Elasticomyces elasticus]
MSHANLTRVWRVITSGSFPAARWQSTTSRHGERWTEPEDDLVRQRRLEGKSFTDIAIETGRTWKSITFRAALLLLKHDAPKPWRPSADDYDEIQRLEVAGHTRREIAKLYNVAKGKLDYLHWRRQRGQHGSMHTTLHADEVSRIVELRAKQPHLGIAGVSHESKRSLSTVKRIVTGTHRPKQPFARPRSDLFSPAEDAQLIDFRERLKTPYSKISAVLSRSAASLRLRYSRFLKDNVVDTSLPQQIHDRVSPKTILETSNHRPTLLQASVPRPVRTYSTVASKASSVNTMVPYGTLYSEFEDNIILQRRRENKAIDHIALELGRSLRSVETRLYGYLSPRVKRSGRKLTDDQIVEIMRLKHAGIALPDIASQHQMSVGSLRALLGHGRVDKSSKDKHCVGVCQEDEQAHMVALRTDQGLSYREIMRRTGWSYSTVYRILRGALDIRRDKPRPRFS